MCKSVVKLCSVLFLCSVLCFVSLLGSCTVLLNVKVRSYYMTLQAVYETACTGYNSLSKYEKNITEFLATKPLKDKCYEKLNDLKKKIGVDLDLINPFLSNDGKAMAGSYHVLNKELIALKDENAKLKAAISEQETATVITDMIKKELSAIVPEITREITKELQLMLPKAVDRPQPDNDEEKHALIIEQKSTDGNAESFTKPQWSDIVKGTLSSKLTDVPVTKSSLTADGKGYVTFPNKESRDIAAEALKKDFVVAEKNTSRKTLLPKMKICDLAGYKKDDKDKLKSIFPKKNAVIKKLVDEGAELEVIFIHEPPHSQFYGGYAVIRLDPRIREEIIKNGRRIYIDTASYYMKDQVHVTQCFACQGFGHKKGSQYCPLVSSDKHTCLYCAESHLSRTCTVKEDPSKHKCINCSRTQKHRYSANHTTTSSQCPLHNREIEGIIRRTQCDSKNFPIQRVTQRQ